MGALFGFCGASEVHQAKISFPSIRTALGFSIFQARPPRPAFTSNPAVQGFGLGAIHPPPPPAPTPPHAKLKVFSGRFCFGVKVRY